MLKKTISLILTLAMLISLLPTFPQTASAVSEDIGSMNALDALGIDTSLMPEGYDENSTDNPYGRNSVTVNPVYELFVTGVGERTESTALVEEIVYGNQTTTTTTVYRQNTLYGHNKALKQSMENFYTSQESLTEQEAYQETVIQTVYDADPTNPIETTVTIRSPIVATATASGNFIGEGAVGKTGQVVTVGAGSLDKNGGLYLYFTDPETGEISGQVKTLLGTDKVIGNSGRKMDEDFAESPYLMQNYLQITAGDFDNNGIDEVAVYVAEQGHSRVEIYKLETTSSSGDDFYLTTSNWKKAWTYYFNEAPYVSNMVSLTSGDFNRDGTDDIALTWGYYYGDENNNACQAVVLYGSNTNMFQVTKDIVLKYNTANIVRAAFTYGDIDGDNVDDLILGGQLASDIAGKNLSTRFIAIYTYDGINDRFIQSTAKNFDLFEKKDGNYVHAAMASRSIKDKYYSSPASTANIAAVNMNGVGKAAYIYLDSLLFEYGDEGLVIKMALDANPSFNKNINSTQKYYVEYGIVAADFTGDCKETLQVMQYYVPLVVTEKVTNYIYIWWWYKYFYTTTVEVELPGDLDMLGVYGGDSSIQVKRTGDVNFSTSFCRLNTDQDTALLKYTGEHYVSYTDPEVLAVLASAPYFADLDNDELSGSYMDSETSYTSSSGSGSGSSTSHTLNLGAYISFEQDFEVFGVKVGSMQAESAYNHGWTWETAKSSTLEQSISYATLAGSDAVAFYSIPMETYVYESLVPVIDEVTGEVTGYDTQYMSVNIPHTAAVKVLPLETYERIAADYSELPQVSGVILTHTVGDPSSYPSSTAGFKNAISYSGDWSGVNYGVGSITQEITMTSEAEKSYTNTNTVEAKIGAGPGNMVFGVSAGYEHGSSQVTVTTSGSSFTGQLFNMPTEAEQYHYNYSWKIFSYEYSGSGNSFPVVSYLVTDVTAPPKLPTDFQQDTVGTTDEKITLTWSYSGAAAGFQIYRYYVFPDGSGSYELAFIPASSAVGADSSGTRYYQYEDTGLYPYTEYDYQIQVIGASQPTDSILSPVYTAKTKINVGYPDISLTGAAGGKLLVYPDTDSKVKVIINNMADYTETPRFQWQKLTDAGWTNIIGATSTEYTFKSAGLADEGQYRCRVNAIYNSYYISAYSEVFTLEYSKRTPTVVTDSFTVIDTTNENNDTVPEINISLTSAHSDHYYVPSGSVIFEITGADYSRSYPVELIPSESGVAGASITLDNPLPDGAYEITAYYSGSRVYKSLTTPNAIAYLSGSESGYVLTLNKSYIYGNTIVPSLKSVQKVEGITSTSPIVGEISYKVVQHSWEWDTEGVMQRNSTIITDFVSDVDGSVTAYQAGNFTLSASIGAEEVASKEFTVVKRKITIGIYDQEDVAGDPQLKHPDSSILKVDSGQLAYNESIVNLGLAVKATNSAGTVVDIVYTTDPGSYTIIGTAGATSGTKYDNYLISYVPGTYVLTGRKYSVVGVSKPLLGKIVGTLEMVSPEGNDNENWTTTYANGTTLGFMAKPNNGYSVKNWSITRITSDGEEVIATGTKDYLSYLMKSEHITVTIEFEVAQRTLTYQAIEGGTVECTNNTVINSGDVVLSGAEFTFKATPIKGYHFVEWQLTEIGKSPTKPVGTSHGDGSNSCQITMGDGNTMLYAIFARDRYTLTLQGELQASYWDDTDSDITTPDELVTTVTGDSIEGDKVVTVTHKPGFLIQSGAVWTQDGVPVSTGVSSDNQSYTFTMLADTVISVGTENEHYGVTLMVEGPGNTKNTVSVTVNGETAGDLSDIAGGSSLLFTPLPAYGYVFDKWIINDVISYDSTLNITALGGDLTVKAVFTNNAAYTISVSHGLRGSLKYTLNGVTTAVANGGEIPVFKGDSVVLTATPETNFMVENWEIDGVVQQTTIKTQTFNDISANLDVVVVFGAQSYSTVTYTAGDGGAISAKSDNNIFDSGNKIGNGTTLEFTATPNSGKMVEKWTLNGVEVKNGLGKTLIDTTFIIPALSGTAVVEVTFAEILTHSVAIQNANTTTTVGYSPEFGAEVRDGATATFTVTPNNGYRITAVGVTGNTGAAGLSGFDSITKQADGKWICVVGAVTADLSVTTEAKQLYSITVPTIPVGGSITVSADKAIEGEEITLTATPASSSYKFSGWTVTDGVTLSDVLISPATFNMPNSNVTVAAAFTFTYYGGGGGGGAGPAVPEFTVQADGTVLVTLADIKGIISDTVNLKLIELNKTSGIVISGNGVKIVIPAGTLMAGDDVNDMIPDLSDAVGEPGQVVVYTDASGKRHIIKWSVVNHNEVSFIVAGSGKYEIVNNSKKFDDISAHWGAYPITFVTARELFMGTSNNKFSANAEMTRAMLVTVLHRLDGFTLTLEEGVNFTDVTNGQWYSYSVAWAAANNIVGGYGKGNFGPNDNVTREQLVSILYRYANFIGVDTLASGNLSGFNDVDNVSDYAQQAMQWATESGLISGRPGGLLDPTGNASRAEVAAILKRFVELVL